MTKLEQITELTLGDTKIVALASSDKLYRINVYQLCDALVINRFLINKFLYDHCSHIPSEERHFVEPSVAAVFLLEHTSKFKRGKSHEMVIKVLTEFLTPRQ